LAIVVLLILVVVWAAVLGPGFLRRMLERRSSDSIGEFHHRLRVLQRTAPATAVSDEAAGPELVRRLRFDDVGDPIGYSAPPAGPGGRGELALVRPAGRESAARGPRSRAQGDPFFRPAACRRRRDVLLCLVGSVLGTAALGAIPELRVALAFTAFLAVVTAAYVMVLVRLRARAEERARKLRYLPPRAEQPVTVVIRQRAAR